MREFGLKAMTSPVLCFMTYSGQMLPTFTFGRILLWLITTGSLVILTLLASTELAVKASSQFGTAIEIITILLTCIEMCWRITYFSRKEKQLLNIISMFNNMPVTCAGFAKSEREMHERAMHRSRRVLVHFSGYVFLILIVYLSVPFIPKGPDMSSIATSDITQSIVNPSRKRPLYIPIWIPGPDIESIELQEYHILVLWQALSFFVMISVFCAGDCLLYAFIIYLVEGMQHLGRVQPGCPLRPKRRQLEGNAWSLDWGLQAEREYRIWVQQHQFLLKLSLEVEKFFSPIILLTFLVNSAVLCVLAYVLIKLRDIIAIICVLGHFSCILIKLYVMATFGQELRDKSMLVAGNEKIWPRLGNNKLTDSRIINIRCNVPTTLTGFGYFDLTLEFFGRVCSVALSYFIVLLQLH